MSSKKKESEGIALLSMYYGDEEDDDDMDTVPEEEQQIEENMEETPNYDDDDNNNNTISSSSVDPLEDNIAETPLEEEAVEDEHNEIDSFLPSPPKVKCSDQLQEKIIKFLSLKKKTGKSFNSEVRNRKEYRNPDFLLHAVTYQDIDQIGTCFNKHVFDPHGYDKSDFYDEIEADLKRELERKEQEKKKSQKIDFLSGGTQSAIPIPTPKVLPNQAVIDTGTRESRPNKKSKWDKVDGGDTRHPLPTGGQDSVSSAIVGSGYTAYAQQRRKEADERRSSDRKC